MSKIAELQDKIELCINNAQKCESEWAQKYWKEVANRLEEIMKVQKVR